MEGRGRSTATKRTFRNKGLSTFNSQLLQPDCNSRAAGLDRHYSPTAQPLQPDCISALVKKNGDFSPE